MVTLNKSLFASVVKITWCKNKCHFQPILSVGSSLLRKLLIDANDITFLNSPADWCKNMTELWDLW